MKQFFLVFVVLLIPCNTINSYDYPYECVYESTPENIRNYFFSSCPGGRLMYGGKDRHGRHLVKLMQPGEANVIFAVYTSETGELWPILIDRTGKREIPFVKVKDPNNEDYRDCHPAVLRDIKEFVDKKSILRPSLGMPRLSEDDYGMIDQLFEVGQENATDVTQDASLSQESPSNKNDYDNTITEQPAVLVEDNESWWPYIVIGGGGFCLSMFVVYYLFSNMATGSRYLRRNDLWSTWRPEDPYEVLLKLEPEYLANDLVHDITVRYAEEAHPIQRFFEDFQVEYDTLLQWLQFRKRLAPWCISLGGAFDIIETRLMLLDHMREAVYHWQAEQLRNNAA